jgi:hypothetical protein
VILDNLSIDTLLDHFFFRLRHFGADFSFSYRHLKPKQMIQMSDLLPFLPRSLELAKLSDEREVKLAFKIKSSSQRSYDDKDKELTFLATNRPPV